MLPVVKNKGKDPVYDTLVHMLEQGASLPGPPGRTFCRAGVKHTMDNDQYEHYLKRSSDLARPKLERLMASSAWERRPEKWRTDTIKAIVAHARNRARSGIKKRMWVEERERKRGVG